MQIRLLPNTRLGKWSMWLIVVSVVFLILFMILVAFGERGGDSFFSNMKLSTFVLIAGIFGVASFLAGLLGIIKSRERSIVVFLSSAAGFFALVFLIGELAFPH